MSRRAGSICRNLSMLIKRNKNEIFDYKITEPAWLARIPEL